MSAKAKTPPSESPAIIKVRVVSQPIYENEFLDKGTVFETTPERAAALGDLVEPV